MKPETTGIRHILKAFTYSYDGFIAAFKSESAFRQDLFFCLIAAITLPFLPAHGVALALMIFATIFILIMELINTAIEYIVDRIGSEYHDLSKKAKDIGSLLVLLAFINFFATWGVILLDVL